MNRGIAALVTITVLSVSTSPSMADDWDRYQEIIGKYHYFVDDQRIDQFECLVRASNSELNEVRSENSPYAFEGFDDLKLSYVKGIGFGIQEPSVVVTVKSTVGEANVQRLKEFLPRINSAIPKIFAGLKRVVMNIVGGYVKPTRENYENVKVTTLDDRSIVTFKVNSRSTTEEYRADSIVGTIDSPEEHRRVDIELTPIGGKMVESRIRSRSKMKGGDSETDLEMVFEYQMFASFPFPSVVEVRTVKNVTSTRRAEDFTIRFDRCVIH